MCEDTQLLDFYERHPTVVSRSIGMLHSQNAWCWLDTNHVAYVAIDLRDALRHAKAAWEGEQVSTVGQ